MAFITVPEFAIPAVFNANTGGPGVGSLLMNASGDRIGFVIQCPKAGTLDKFEFRTAAVGNNPDNGLRVSFQTVSLTDGNPDGTQSQYRDITGTIAANTWQVPGLMTSDGTDSGAKRVVGAGELLGCVIDFVSFTASDSVNVSVLSSIGDIARNIYTADATSGAYVKNASNMPVLALKYDDGTYAEFDIPIWPMTALSGISFNSGSTGDERGLLAQVAAPMRTNGVWAYVDGDAAFDIVLYDAGGSVLSTLSFDPDQRSSINGFFYRGYWPNGPHEIAANTNVRAVVKPTSGSSVTLWELDVPSAGYMACVSGGVNWMHTLRTDAGPWTDTATKRPLIGLRFNGVDDGTGGGGSDLTPYAVAMSLIGPGGLVRAV